MMTLVALKLLAALAVAACLLPGSARAGAAGREFFVSPTGLDSFSGLSRAEPFRTVNQGISVLGPGDTLTILPGEYFESITTSLSGTPEAPVTIRAERPGTAWLRGCREIGAFRRSPGTLYTYEADFDLEVEGVAERSTLVQYSFVPSPLELDEVPGSFYYDPREKLLRVRTSDGRDPGLHALAVSVTPFNGLLLERGSDLVIDGLVFSGYNSRDVASGTGWRTRWGIYLLHPERVTVRRCTVFFNGGGITVNRGNGVLIEECLVFANSSPHDASGGNISTRGASRDIVYRGNISHSTDGHALRFYTGGGENCRVENNLVYGAGGSDIQFKGGDYSTCSITGNVALGAIHPGTVRPEKIRHNVFGRRTLEGLDASNIFTRDRGFDPATHFADPAGRDYRLLPSSPLAGTAPDGSDPGPGSARGEVFFVSPDGNDEDPGTTPCRPWATLARAAAAARAGQAVYLREGTYRESLVPANSGEPGRPVVFRSYGGERVILDGGGEKSYGVLLEERAHVTVEGLEVTGFTGAGFRASGGPGLEISRNLVFRNASGIVLDRSPGTRLSRNLLEANGIGLSIAGSSRVTAESNLFAGNGHHLSVDSPSAASLWSDRNGFASPVTTGSMLLEDREAGPLEKWRSSTGLDRNSPVVAPLTLDPDHGPGGLPPGSDLVGRGALASTIGPREEARPEKALLIEGLRVHSVTATTANLEWWTPSTPAATILQWWAEDGTAGEVAEVHSESVFHTVGLSGLEPGTAYRFRVRALSPARELHSDPALAAAEATRERLEATLPEGSFRTLEADPPPRLFHVSPGGSDDHDGLSPDRPWRTIRHAAAKVRAGDTVQIGPGVYRELVVVRATGDEGRPVTFRASPDGEAWLEGSRRVRPTAFRVAHQSHVRLEGLRFREFALSAYGKSGNTGAVRVIGGSSVTVHRCFYDGRSALGYTAFFLHATGSRGLVVDNCVVVQGWNGASFWRCPDLEIRHSVFYNCLIRALFVFNEPDEAVTLSHNLICDNIPGKVGNSIVATWHIESLAADHNFYFVRLPAEERILVSAIRVGGERPGASYTFPGLREIGLERHGLFGNPGIPVTGQMVPAPEDWPGTELHRSGADIRPLDFRHFLADPDGPAGRAADGRPIGLDRRLFP